MLAVPIDGAVKYRHPPRDLDKFHRNLDNFWAKNLDMGTGTVTGDAPHAIAAAAAAEMPGATSSRSCKTQLQNPVFSLLTRRCYCSFSFLSCTEAWSIPSPISRRNCVSSSVLSHLYWVFFVHLGIMKRRYCDNITLQWIVSISKWFPSSFPSPNRPFSIFCIYFPAVSTHSLERFWVF